MKVFFISAVITIISLVGLSAQATALDATDTTLSAAGDAKKGKRLFNRCKACHNLTAAPRHRMGPNLNGLFGRHSAAAEGYKYSKAMLATNFVWDEAKLDEWLAKPKAFLPGNKMIFPGLKKEQDRKNIIAYLRDATITK